MREHEELIRDRELHVPPGVREELRDFGLARAHAHRAWLKPLEETRGAVCRDVVVGADDLGQAAQLLERMAFENSLGAHRDIDALARGTECLGHQLGRARKDGAAEDHERAVLDVGHELS